MNAEQQPGKRCDVCGKPASSGYRARGDWGFGPRHCPDCWNARDEKNNPDPTPAPERGKFDDDHEDNYTDARNFFTIARRVWKGTDTTPAPSTQPFNKEAMTKEELQRMFDLMESGMKEDAEWRKKHPFRFENIDEEDRHG